MLDVLRLGEDSVKLGLSDKINLEVTLLKAVDASRARAIDSLLRELTQLGAELSASAASPGPGEEKKKP
jgi:DNA polymerase-3 subunit gamma/tau